MLVFVQKPVMNRSKSYEWVYIDVLGGEGGWGTMGTKTEMFSVT